MGEKMIEEAKKVNLTELFYDLVFVFGISKITHVLHSLERGIFSLNEIIIYIVVFVCFINVWNVQTVYMNRYGKHNLLHIIIMTVLQMPALLLWLQMSARIWRIAGPPLPWRFYGFLLCNFCNIFSLILSTSIVKKI